MKFLNKMFITWGLLIVGVTFTVGGFIYKFGLADGVILLGIILIVAAMLKYMKDNPI